MSDSKDETSFLEKLGAKVAGIYFVIVLILLLTCASWMAFPNRFDQFAIWTPLYLLLGMVVIGCVLVFAYLVRKISCMANCLASAESWLSNPRQFALIIIIGITATLIWDGILYYQAGFRTDWDVVSIADGGYYRDPIVLGTKLSRDPNLIFLAGLFGKLRLLASLLRSGDPYWILVAGSLFSMLASVVLSTYIVKKIASPIWAIGAMLILLVLVGGSPWFFIPYSDQYGMLPVCLIVWIYLYFGDKLFVWGLMTCTAVIGYAIKPTVVFIYISILVYTVVRAGCDAAKRQVDMQEIAGYVVAIGLGIVVGCLGIQIISPSEESAYIDTTKGKGVAHYLMMGAHIGDGGYDGEDTAFTLSISDPKERTRENMRVFFERIEAMGPLGLMQHSISKTLSNFDDASFAWTVEGYFFDDCRGTGGPLQQLYGIPTRADKQSDPKLGSKKGELQEIVCNSPYFKICEILWFAVLEGLPLAGLLFLPTGKKSSVTISAILVSTMVLGLFLMVFEARSRYLFLYVPMFVAAGVWGWRAIIAHILSKVRCDRG